MLRIKEIRKAQGMRQVDLAEMVGRNATTIGRIERGLTDPPFSLLVKIARALHVTIGQLLGVHAWNPGRIILCEPWKHHGQGECD